MKIPLRGYLDTEANVVVIEQVNLPKKRGARPTSESRLVALILADHWANNNYSAQKTSKEERFCSALPKRYSEGGSQRRAVSNAKKQEGRLFRAPFGPGRIIHGQAGAIWFVDRAIHATSEAYGYGWVWHPGMNDAVFTIVRARKEGKLIS